jgi:hypothetical protein
MGLQLTHGHYGRQYWNDWAHRLGGQLGPVLGGLALIWGVLTAFATVIAAVRFGVRAVLFGWEEAAAAVWHLFVMPPLRLGAVLLAAAVILLLLRSRAR